MSQLNHTFDIQNQVTDATLDITGTPFGLQYRSDRVRGRRDRDTVTISLSDDSVPEPLKRIELEISAAGHEVTEQFPAEPNQDYTYVWPRRNAYGTPIQGERDASIQLGYVYDLVYASPAQFDRSEFDQSFASFGDTEALDADRDRMEITSWQRWTVPVGGWDATMQGLGGWNVDIHHAYDPVSETLYLGDGRQRSSANIASVASIVAGGGQFQGVLPWEHDGELSATEARLINPTDIVAAPDDNLYVADAWADRVYRIDPDGVLTTFAGSHETTNLLQGDSSYNRDRVDLNGLQATETPLYGPEALALGKDGLYVVDSHYVDVPLVVRIDPDGTVSNVAGGGDADPNGVPATQADVNYCSSAIAVSEDESLYLGRTLLAKVTPDGTITTVAGDGDQYLPDIPPEETIVGLPAAQVRGLDITDIDIGPDGGIYFTTSGGGLNAVFRIDPDGTLTRIAGGGTIEVEQALEEAIRATDVALESVQGVVVDSVGDVYVSDGHENHRILSVAPDGTLGVAAGSGSLGAGSFEEVPAARAEIGDPEKLDLAPDDSLYVSQGLNGTISQIRTALPGLSGGETAVASEDGDQLFVFDSTGRHVETLHTLTGAVLYHFEYEEGYLSAVEDGDGNVTQIERDADGNLTAIVSPYGQRTVLDTRDDEMLTSITNPAEETYEFEYNEGGLLTSYTEPRGTTASLRYDNLGRLISQEEPGGGRTDMVRSQTDDGFEVKLITPKLRESRYLVENLGTSSEHYVKSCCEGTVVETFVDSNAGERRTTFPDGSREFLEESPDPRFGMQAPFISTRHVENASGLSEILSFTQSVESTDPTDSLNLQYMTITATYSGGAYTSSLNKSENQFETRSPEGRNSHLMFDDKGRISATQFGDLEPERVDYDERGQLASYRHGDQVISYEYGSTGFLQSIRDASGAQVTFQVDDAGRIVEAAAPGGRKYRFNWDNNGNQTEIIMPNDATHSFAFTENDLLAEYRSPQGDIFSMAYNQDQDWTETTLPSGRTINTQYTGSGLISTLTYPEAVVDLAYDDARRFNVVQRESSNQSDEQELQFTYNGELLTETTWSGDINGAFGYNYSDAFALSTISLPDNTEIELTRDADGLLTAYGPFTISRNAPMGAPSQISDATFTEQIEYDDVGRLRSRTHSVAGEEIYRLELSYDNRSLITRKLEAFNGDTDVYNYTYDSSGRLLSMTRNDEVLERYQYDENGNRVTKTIREESTVLAEYNSQDQLLRQGDTPYEFNRDGFLIQRGDEEFRYTTRGELLAVTNSSGREVSYSYDGFGRRITCSTASGTLEYLYGNPGNLFEVTMTRGPTGSISTYYYDDSGHLFAIQRDDSWYYVATDQVGSPKVVSNATGDIIKSLKYGSFGTLIEDSNPDFMLPIGFAGGLNDPHSSLVRFGFRDYNPPGGSWCSRDPILFSGGQFNLYSYVNNNPVNWNDPSGLQGRASGVGGTTQDGWGSRVRCLIDCARRQVEKFARNQCILRVGPGCLRATEEGPRIGVGGGVSVEVNGTKIGGVSGSIDVGPAPGNDPSGPIIDMRYKGKVNVGPYGTGVEGRTSVGAGNIRDPVNDQPIVKSMNDHFNRLHKYRDLNE